MAVTALVSEISPVERASHRLWEIIKEKSLRRGETFKLSSGEESSFFFDMKMTMLDPEGANLIAELILDRPEVAKANAVGGLEMGAVPIVSVVCAKSFYGKKIPAFFVRKEKKGHGTNQLIDGNLEAGWHVVLVDDVTTTGGSVLKAVRAARDRGCFVDAVVTVVDRMQGARENLASENVNLVALFQRSDFED